jgi:hypothetical protein
MDEQYPDKKVAAFIIHFQFLSLYFQFSLNKKIDFLIK